MIDLINKNINELIQKYSTILDTTYQEEQIPYIAYIIDYSINYVKEKYGELNIDWKCWTVLLIKQLFLSEKIKSESDINKEIDNFINHYNVEYLNYCNNITFSASDYDKDRGFVYEYIWKNYKTF